MADEAPGKIQTKVTEGLNGMFDQVIDSRQQHFVENPAQVPQRGDVESIIARYANTNAAIAGAAGLVPGPWGMLAAIPEIIAVVRNQTAMIYDICVALGKQRQITRELLVGVLLSGMGAGGGSLLVVQGSKLLVRRASLRVMQKLIAMLGGKVTQQLLKSMVGKWLPIVGAAAMAAWARYTTKRLGEQAFELLSKDIEAAGEVLDDDEVAAQESVPAAPQAPVVTKSPPSQQVIELTKIRVLINLMVADQKIAPEEVSYIRELIADSALPADDRAALEQLLAAGKRVPVDYDALRDSPDDRLGLLVSMAALAHKDGKVHIAERLFIKQVAQQIGFSEADVRDALEEEAAAAAQA